MGSHRATSTCLFFNAMRNDAQGLRDHGTPWSLVSSLQALMQDQVLSLRDEGVSAVIACNFSENVETLKSDIVCGKYLFVFVTPELLLTDRKWTDVFRSQGDEFRKDFSKLGDFCGFILKNVKFIALALSVTMSKSTWTDSEMEEVFDSVLEELRAKRLQLEKSRMGVVIATVAFRLGTDCPNVCKETGWAGRDGQLSFATLYYNGQDISFAFMEKEIVEYWPPKENCLKCGKAIPIAELKSHISMCEKSLISIFEELQCSMEGETFEMVDGAPLRLFAHSVYDFTCGIEPSKINVKISGFRFSIPGFFVESKEALHIHVYHY
uniref:DNA 3'-5' helicase n=1 Tax=Amphimedon queenslandica TaxID=400682 RepID=A0A1X7V2P9_AMPQE